MPKDKLERPPQPFKIEMQELLIRLDIPWCRRDPDRSKTSLLLTRTVVWRTKDPEMSKVHCLPFNRVKSGAFLPALTCHGHTGSFSAEVGFWLTSACQISRPAWS